MKYFLKIILFTCVTVINSHKLTNQISVCSKSEGTNYSNCLLKKIEEHRHLVYRDLPEFNLPSLDPFRIPKLSVKHNLDPVHLNLEITNATITGFGNFEIKKLKVDVNNLTAEIHARVKKCRMESNYNVGGRLLVLDMDSEGYFKGNFSDINIKIKSKLKEVDKNGTKYFSVDNLSSKISVGNGKVEMKSSDPNNEEGTNIIENFFNEEPREVMDAVNPILINTSNAIYLKLLNEVLMKIPAKRLLPD